MSLITNIKEKVATPRATNRSRNNEEELRNLDSLIEDLFKMDEQSTDEKQQEKES